MESPHILPSYSTIALASHIAIILTFTLQSPLTPLPAVLACIMRDDAKLEIKIKIPPHYPLKNVAVETVTRSGVPEAKWRRWAFQIIQLLSMQVRQVKATNDLNQVQIKRKEKKRKEKKRKEKIR